ncbi:MAG: hypothetical protein QOE47_3033 [Pyrinomonadaceae bacterium]|jgi:hypothetical protein|nr:hypothetical protein [Pyrinomonadaceae bacterium]
MRRNSLPALTAFFIVALLTLQIASAQIPRIPRIPKPQPKPTPATTAQPTSDAQPAPSQPETRNEAKPAAASTASASGGQDHPTIAKDSVQLRAFTFSSYKGNYDTFSWAPLISYRVNGPIPSGGQLYVEYTVPGAPPVKFDCRTEETPPDRWWKTECGGRDGVPEEKGTTYTGPFTFAIKMRNELAGADTTIFNGKAKAAKVHSNEIKTGKFANHFVYYIDHDWNLPIGYVYYTQDELKGWERPLLNVAFWVRGEAYNLDPHLFYQGKEVGRIMYEGEQVGKASCESDVDNNTTHFVDEKDAPQKAKWARVRCTFNNVRGWDRSGEAPGMFGALYQMDKNPGEYELKVLWNNKLARSIKFNVPAGGKLDNSLAASNKLGTERLIVPVTIIGDQDGTWDKAAWKTEAFYGNPLTGFTPVP